jgi:hypothetical protein
VSNIIYIGLIVIAAYCAVHQVLKIRQLGVATIKAGLAVGSWSLVLPFVYFLAVAYPATTTKPEYASASLKYVHQNLQFYRAQLAPSAILAALYIAVLVFALVGGVLAARRRDWFPLAVLGTAGATAAPALVQSQQRFVFYLAMPLLLTFSAFAAGARPLLRVQSRHLVQLSGGLLLAAGAMLVLVFGQGADLRSFFVQTPYGHRLNEFRSEVASLTSEAGAVCARLNLDAPHQALFNAEMSGANGFLIPPISVGQVFLLPPNTTCPARNSPAQITVSLDARGDFIAAG